VTDVYLADKLAAPVKREAAPTVTLTNAQLSTRTGVYWNAADDEAHRWILKDGKLVIQSPGEVELAPAGENRFRDVNNVIEIAFNGDSYDVTGPNIAAQHYRRVEAANPDARQLAEYAGDYYSSEIDSIYHLEVKDGKLAIHRKKVLTNELDPTLRGVFHARGLGLVRFERDNSGRITGFRLTDGRVKKLLFMRNSAR